MKVNRLRDTVADRPIDVQIVDSPIESTDSAPSQVSLIDRIMGTLNSNQGRDISLADIPSYDKG